MDIVNTLDLKTLNLQIVSPSQGTSCRDLSISENGNENYNRSDDSQIIYNFILCPVKINMHIIINIIQYIKYIQHSLWIIFIYSTYAFNT